MTRPWPRVVEVRGGQGSRLDVSPIVGGRAVVRKYSAAYFFENLLA